MKLDPTVMRTMNRQDFRVLAAVETGMKNHALVPAKLITSIANLRHGGTNKILSSLLRDKLLSHDRSCGYDGYRLTNSGYDILALHNLKSRGFISAIGDKIGTGKESDVYVAANKEGKQIVLKIHRLGRTSFRDVKKKRDYFMVNATSKSKKHGIVYKQQPNSWLFLSRISALKEYSFMKALSDVGYPTPNPICHNRHIVVMSLVRGIPLYQMHSNRVSAEQAESIFIQSTDLATRLAKHGLVHCDLNEFNLMVDLSGIQDKISDDNDVAEHYVRHSGMSVASKGALSAHCPIQKHHIDGTGEFVTEKPPEPNELLSNGEPKPIVTLIDFPQMVSTRHPNAKELYDRDMDCLKRFFVTKLRCLPAESNGSDGWDDIIPSWESIVSDEIVDVDDNYDNSKNDNSNNDAKRNKQKQLHNNDDSSICVAARAQLRLDEELKASGFSADDSKRDIELYYYEKSQSHNLTPVDDEDNEKDDEEYASDSIDEEGSRHKFDNNDNDSIESLVAEEEENGDDPNSHRVSVFHNNEDESVDLFSEQSLAAAEEKARIRVRRHLEDRKKKNGRKNAFKSRNSNKTFEKGKRVMMDFGI